jgi:hypothetical protein
MRIVTGIGHPSGSSRSTARPLPPRRGVQHRFIDTASLTFHVAQAGAGEPVLLLHGWPQHWYAWRRVIPLLAVGAENLVHVMRPGGIR